MSDHNYFFNKFYYDAAHGNIDFPLKKNLLAEIIKWGFIAVLILAVILPICLHFYKGKKRTVQIIKLRKTVRDLFQPANTFKRNSYVEFVHYTVDVKYLDGKHIHTFNCSEDMFNELVEGKTYTVLIRFTNLMKIYGQ